MNQVEFPVGSETGSGEVGRPNNGEDGPEPVEHQLLAGPVGIKQPALGVQKSLVIKMDGNLTLLQVGDQVFHQSQGGFIEGENFQILADQSLNGLRSGFESDLFSGDRFGSQ